ncbi:LacI family DNA-binding transcriptional regulator [Planctobacterium marinum]|uniref:LacI family DNA-binding transcriptional regulator n=1 Tax=Planctobacterium marinum TaxID=1631968 RepID=UPI001E59F4F7|nr:LacI family DNA-binding transcriptional regulator [Planctobacterium marinum]MCC2606074.1 LacI family DNA-binding transcriptional regulator [Planctobacterium marinum]
MKATIKDVAKLAGVSIKTVSRVINKEDSVKPDTELKVQAAIDELSYRPNSSARNLAATQSFAIGYIYDNPNAYYVIDMQNGILKECLSNGFELIIHPCNASDENIVSEVKDMVRRSQLAGLVLSPPLSEMPEVLAALDEINMNYVRILSGAGDKQTTGPCVLVNDRSASEKITEHLITLAHQRIAFITGDKDHQSTDERLQGYKTALLKHQLAVEEQLIIDGHYSFEAGVEGAKTLLSLNNPPTAIFACNDEIAAGALFAARLMSFDVPKDVAIAGFEDNPFSRQTWPKLTTAAQPTSLIARKATSLLIRTIKNKRKGDKEDIHNQYFEPELVVRESTHLSD